MTTKEFTEVLKRSLFTRYIDSSTKPLIELLQEDNKGYLKIHDAHTKKTYTMKEAKRILKIEQL